MGSSGHRIGLLLPIIGSLITMVTMFIFNGLSAIPLKPLFLNSTGDISNIYYLNIVPSGPTFSIWGIIYAWQVIFIGYGLSTICRQGIDGYLYYSPRVMPVWIYITYMINNGLNIAWLFLWDRSVPNRDLLIGAVIVLALTAFSLYLCIGFSCYAVDKYYSLLAKHKLTREVWMIRFMVQNAFAFYATWTSIATLLNLGSCLSYRGTVDQNTSSVIILGILSAEIVFWFILDTFFLDRYVRFLFAPYIVLVWALTGSVMKNYVPGGRNAIFTVVLLAIACAALVVKIVLMIWRGIRCPLYANSMTLVSPDYGKKNSGYVMDEASGKNM